MRKQINIDGMSCEHCVKHVTNALKELDQVTNVNVDLKGNHAVIDLSDEVSDKEIKDVIEDAGYDVVSIIDL